MSATIRRPRVVPIALARRASASQRRTAGGKPGGGHRAEAQPGLEPPAAPTWLPKNALSQLVTGMNWIQVNVT